MKKLFIIFILLAGILIGSYAESSEPIAFAANLNGNWDLFVYDENGLKQLTDTPYDEKEPSWSHDRKRLVYATSGGSINVIDIDSGEQYKPNIDTKSVSKFSPAFSTDSKKIAFVEFIPGEKDDTDLMVFDMETKNTRKVLEQYAGQFRPSWSPDGRYLVYTNNHCSDCGRLIQELWITDAEGGYARQLLMLNSLSQQPVWSPDGSQIAFSSDKSGNFDIWVLSLADWKLKQLTADTNLDISPTWSPDGSRLAFVSTRSGKMEIWIKNIKDGTLEKLQPFGDKDIECKDAAW